VTLLASIAVMLVLEASAGWLIEFAFGDDFEGATPIARILLIGAVFMSGKRVLSDGVRGAGHPTLGTIAELASWVALAIGLAILVPLDGVTGAAWAVTASFVVNFALLVILTLSSTGLRAPAPTPERPDSVPAAS
jgi:Na+-driven multidrug efflux pump